MKMGMASRKSLKEHIKERLKQLKKPKIINEEIDIDLLRTKTHSFHRKSSIYFTASRTSSSIGKVSLTVDEFNDGNGGVSKFELNSDIVEEVEDDPTKEKNDLGKNSNDEQEAEEVDDAEETEEEDESEEAELNKNKENSDDEYDICTGKIIESNKENILPIVKSKSVQIDTKDIENIGNLNLDLLDLDDLLTDNKDLIQSNENEEIKSFNDVSYWKKSKSIVFFSSNDLEDL